ncbi:inhibitor of growth protein 1 [Condylostylus longicornis]|uniref:inhibitor of growth protein 1 n=1 Tax=Condylostylus longicornis TaxID=2530218 RepID=UPI00244DCC3E|nr:inhibitor of growth protein 1 [Condylostylus longicornis]
MLNQISAEALYSATFVENYMDCVENLPDDVQRHLSRIRDIDVQVRNYLRDVENYYDQWVRLTSSTNESDIQKRSKLMAKIQKSFINAQELGDEKMQTVNQLQELIDQKTRQVDLDYKNLDYGKEDQLMDTSPIGVSTSGIGSTSGTSNINIQSGNNNIQKTPRPHSPISSQLLPTSAIKVESTQQNVNYSIAQTITTIMSGGNTPSQRGNTPTISEKNNSNNNNNNNSNNNNNNNSNNSGNNNNNSNPIEQRTTSKRSRRPRNENNSNVNETGGNESNNSANESGNNRNSTQSNAISGSNSGNNNNANNSNSGNSKKTGGQGGAGGKKKKRKTRGQNNQNQKDQRDETPPPDPIDPDEPTYCLCDQISFGEMILCDNDLCPIEWFHFSCVSLMSKPKGKWFCPNCRGDRPNVMKPKAQFLKELERYNKEKEEKT